MDKKTTEKNLVPYQKSVSLILERANNLQIKSEDQIIAATDILSEVGRIEKRVKEEKEKLTKPANEIIKWARTIFGPIEKAYKEAEYIIKDKMVGYNQLVEEQNKKKLEKISKKVAEGKIDIDQASEKVEGLENQNQYKGESGSITFKTIKRLYITNVEKIPRKYLVPHEGLIKEALMRGEKIPGAELKEEKIVAKR